MSPAIFAVTKEVLTLLEKINDVADLRALGPEELPGLCGEIRRFLIENVSKTGGHLASNLGTVELCVALDRVYDPYRDRIVFDVGAPVLYAQAADGQTRGLCAAAAVRGHLGLPETLGERGGRLHSRARLEQRVRGAGHGAGAHEAGRGL